MADNAIFEFKTPEGKILEWEGPSDTPRDQVHNHFYQAILKNPDLSPAIAKQQGAGYQSKPAPDADRTAGQVASDQAAEVLSGVPKAVTALPGAAYNAAKTALTGDAKGAVDMVKGAVKPYATAIKGGAALAGADVPEGNPDNQDWKDAAQAGGASLAASELPNALEGAAKVAGPVASATRRFASNVTPTAVGDAAANSPVGGFFTRTPDNLLKRVMPNVELEHIQRAGSDLKAAEATTGKPITDVPSALEAENVSANSLNNRINSIIEPQKGITVPGSRGKFVDDQIAQIPDDIRIHDPQRFQSITDDLEAQRSLPDLTIGEINDARVSANKLRRSYYNSKLGAQLTKDEQLNNALLAGRDQAAHQLMDYGVDQVGLGGAGAIKNMTQRLGSLIKVKEGLQGVSNAAELQAGAPAVSRFGQQAASVIDKVKGNPEAFDRASSINNDIATAMRRWQGKPADFSLTQSPAFARPGAPAAGGQGELAPSGGPGVLGGPNAQPKPYQPGMSPMDAVPGQKAWAAGAPPKAPGQLTLDSQTPPDLFGVDTPQGPSSPQGQLPLSGAQDQTPYVKGQKSFSFPQTDREAWLEKHFKENPGQDEATKPPRRFSPK